MKLRNKKTGEIISEIDVSQDHESIWVLENKPRVYHSLAELNEEWEDYDEQCEKEAIAVLKQLSEALDKTLDKINANMSKLCGGKKE